MSWKALERKKKAAKQSQGSSGSGPVLPEDEALPSMPHGPEPALAKHTHSSNPLASVIQKIERMYGAAYAESETETETDPGEDDDAGADPNGNAAEEAASGQGGKPKGGKGNKGAVDDHYDHYDDFIDDTELVKYMERGSKKTKHDGFFINKGKLETRGASDASGGTGTASTRTNSTTDDFKPKRKRQKKKSQAAKQAKEPIEVL